LEAPLALRRADGAAEVLGGDDVGRVHRPEVGKLDAVLLEVDRAVPPVRHDNVPAFPGHLVIGVHAGGGVDALHPQPGASRLGRLGGLPLAGRRAAHRLRHCVSPFRDLFGSLSGPAWPLTTSATSGDAGSAGSVLRTPVPRPWYRPLGGPVA